MQVMAESYEKDINFMEAALAEAQQAAAIDEVPVGAVLVHQNNIIARAHNTRESHADPTAHAEMTVIREAARQLNSWRLNDCTIYCTLEPCPMCAGAMINARIKRVVYGLNDPKSGACESVLRIFDYAAFNHKVEYQGGVLKDRSLYLLREFFKKKR